MKATTALGMALSQWAVSTLAQEIKYQDWLYNSPDCGADPNNPDLQSIQLTVMEGAGMYPDSCMVASVGLPGWELKDGQTVTYLTGRNIPQGCYILFYGPPPALEEGNAGPCPQFIRRMDPEHSGGCTEQLVPPKFSYGMCCGSATDCYPGPSKRENIADSDVVDVTKIKRAPLIKESRDIAKAKRAPLSNEKRACEFVPAGEPYVHFGPQQPMGGTINCPAGNPEPCPRTYEMTVGFSRSSTFGVEIGIGGELFKAITGSVTFSASYTEEITKETTIADTWPVPPGASGTMAWSPQLECVDGHFTGCAETNGDRGTACFQMYDGGNVNGMPLGDRSYIRLN